MPGTISVCEIVAPVAGSAILEKLSVLDTIKDPDPVDRVLGLLPIDPTYARFITAVLRTPPCLGRLAALSRWDWAFRCAVVGLVIFFGGIACLQVLSVPANGLEYLLEEW